MVAAGSAWLLFQPLPEGADKTATAVVVSVGAVAAKRLDNSVFLPASPRNHVLAAYMFTFQECIVIGLKFLTSMKSCF